MASLRRREEQIRRLIGERLLQNGLYIMGTTVVTSVFGLVYWIVATHDLRSEEVGRGAALLSAVLLVSVFTNFGVGQLYISRLHSRADGHEWSLTVTTGLAITVTASVIGGVIAAVVVPALVPALRHSIGGLVFLLIPVGVAVAACSAVLDNVCVAERKAKPSMMRNGGMAVSRLVLIAITPLVPVRGAVWILVTWVGSYALFDAIAIVRMLPSLRPGFRLTLSGWRRELIAMRGLLAGHQAINMGEQSSQLVLPLLVTARLGTAQGAFFYTTFMVANGVFFIAPAICNSLFAEGARDPAEVGRHVRAAIRYIVVLAGPPALILLVAGRLILHLFGARYAQAGGVLLLTLVGAAVFDAGGLLVTSVLRVRERLRQGAIATFSGLALAVVSTWALLPPLGLVGSGVGWAIGKAGGLIVGLCFMAYDRRGGKHAGDYAGAPEAAPTPETAPG